MILKNFRAEKDLRYKLIRDHSYGSQGLDRMMVFRGSVLGGLEQVADLPGWPAADKCTEGEGEV